MTGCGAEPVQLAGMTTAEAVQAFVEAQQGDGRRAYEQPPERAADRLASAVLALGGGRRQEAERLAGELSYRVVELADALALAPERIPDDRGWGLYVVQPDGADLAVEVPHPRADLETETLGALLAERVGARYLLLAGAHRDAADEQADVAREAGSAFSVVHAALAGGRVPALQLHGFAAGSLPGVDVVVSPGASELSALARGVAEATELAGLQVCRAWQDSCGRLEGRSNAQGQASRDAGAAFVHLELTRDLRRADRRDEVLGALSRAIGL